MEEKEIRRLLQEYNSIMGRLAKAGVIRGDRLVSEYGEYLVAQKLNLTLMPPSNRDYDAVDKDGIKYQIKTRKASARAAATIIPIDRSSEELKTADFEFLLALFFDSNWNVRFLLKIPKEDIVPNKYERISVNKNLIVKYNIWSEVMKQTNQSFGEIESASP